MQLFILRRFWVASAPLTGDGHVNISPKGGPYFGIPDDHTFWFLDLSGSGNETIAHIYEPGNGRVTIMFNAFDGPPEIVRFWGKGRVLEFGTQPFLEWVKTHNIDVLPGTRSIIIVDIHQVGSSCGFSVPFYDFKEHRDILNNLWEKRKKDFEKGKTEFAMPRYCFSKPSPFMLTIFRYWAYKSAFSMDGLPGMKLGLLTGKTEKIAPIVKMVGPLAPKNADDYNIRNHRQTVLIVLLSFLLGVFTALYGIPAWLELKGQLKGVPIAKNLIGLPYSP